MGFTSTDDMVSELTAGKSWLWVWNKITGASAYTAGRWYDFSLLNGSPIANAFSGTALAWQTMADTNGFGIWHGGNVSTDTKHLLFLSAVTGVATGVPGYFLLVDMQGYWPGISNNSAVAQNLTGTPTLRYTNGVGLRLFWVQTSAAGATAQNLSLSYTDQDNNTGNTMPVTVAMTASAIVGHVSHSGTAANNYGPFLPLASGDYGVRNVASVTFSAANTGTGALVLARPIAEVPVVTASVEGAREMVNQMMSLERIYDGACLTWLYFAGAATAANTNFFGVSRFGWG